MYKQMTNMEYVATRGQKCPACQSTNIDAQDADEDDCGFTQEVECLDCHATWTDVYDLTAYRDLEIPK